MKKLLVFAVLVSILIAQSVPIKSTYLPILSTSSPIVSSTSIPSTKPISSTPTTSIISKAQCFEGTVSVNIVSGSFSNFTYNACFDSYPETCSYNKCYNGWIANYTTNQGQTVQGYPLGNNIQPVFTLKINSAADYVIYRNSNLLSAFVDIIEMACAAFDPTVLTATPNLITAKSSSATPSTIIPDSVFVPTYAINDKVNASTVKIGKAPVQNIMSPQLKSTLATVSRSFEFDTVSNFINSRQDLVNIKLPSDYLQMTSDDSTKAQNQTSFDFNGIISMKLIKKTTLSYDYAKFSAEIAAIKNNAFTTQQIETRRTNVTTADIRADNVASVDTMSVSSQKSGENQSFAYGISAKIDQIYAARTAISIATTQSLPVNNPSRLLASQVDLLFQTQYKLYSKTILGKSVEVYIIAKAELLDKKNIRMFAQIKFVIFGTTKYVTVVDFTRSADYNWSDNKVYNGVLNFNIYISLPPPASIIGINFSFSSSYSINVKLSSTGVYTASINVYDFKIGALVNAEMKVDASATLRVAVIEGGVFIQGTLVSLQSNPNVNLKFLLSQQKIQVLAQWNYTINGFQCVWGFIWRYWKPFKWSGWKPIASWPMNSVSETKEIMNINKIVPI